MATITSVSNGSWNSASSWDGGVPGSNDDVVIINYSPTLNANVNVRSIAITNAASLTFGTYSVYTTNGISIPWGSLTINSGATVSGGQITVGGTTTTGKLNFSNGIIYANVVVTPKGSIAISGSSAKTFNGLSIATDTQSSPNNNTISGSGTITLNGSTTLTGYGFSGGGNLTINGSFINSGLSNFFYNTSMLLQGSGTLTFYKFGLTSSFGNGTNFSGNTYINNNDNTYIATGTGTVAISFGNIYISGSANSGSTNTLIIANSADTININNLLITSGVSSNVSVASGAGTLNINNIQNDITANAAITMSVTNTNIATNIHNNATNGYLSISSTSLSVGNNIFNNNLSGSLRINNATCNIYQGKEISYTIANQYIKINGITFYKTSGAGSNYPVEEQVKLNTIYGNTLQYTGKLNI